MHRTFEGPEIRRIYDRIRDIWNLSVGETNGYIVFIATFVPEKKNPEGKTVAQTNLIFDPDYNRMIGTRERARDIRRYVSMLNKMADSIESGMEHEESMEIH